jgi:hypothetical protein
MVDQRLAPRRDGPMTEPASFQDHVRSPAGRRQLVRWMAGSAAIFSVCFGLFAWYAEAEVPFPFWPIIAGGGALLGLHVCRLRWQAKMEKEGWH